MLVRLVLTFASAACAPHVDVAGAPCPCPSGYACCPTLSECVARGDEAACPDAQPPSSGAACKRDADCQTHELCQAWKTSQGKLAGPQHCRKTCNATAPCASGETCQLIAHDGSLLEQSDLTRACIPDTDSELHESCVCSECESAELGRVFCDGSFVKGCFLAFNDVCGVSCKKVVVQNCGGAGCRPGASGGECLPNADSQDGCEGFPCTSCGTANTCSGHDVRGCLRTPYDGASCDELCLPVTFACPADASCVSEPAAHCSR